MSTITTPKVTARLSRGCIKIVVKHKWFNLYTLLTEAEAVALVNRVVDLLEKNRCPRTPSPDTLTVYTGEAGD